MNKGWFPKLTVEQSASAFWNRVCIGDVSDCWEWKRRKTPDGYGRTYFLGKENRRVHRIAWELTNGIIPNGLQVLHKCDNPACCNPVHLFLGTQKDNIADMKSKGRAKNAVAKIKEGGK